MISSLFQQTSLASSSSLSSSMGNIAKPIVEGSNVQQILPFKLSENLSASVASSSTIPVSLASSSRSSPKTSSGYQKLSSLPSPPIQPNKGRTPPSGRSGEVNHQRTGSSPAQTGMTTSPRSTTVSASGVETASNTLPKSSASFNSGSGSSPAHGKRGKESKYNVTSEDKVIYF